MIKTTKTFKTSKISDKIEVFNKLIFKPISITENFSNNTHTIKFTTYKVVGENVDKEVEDLDTNGQIQFDTDGDVLKKTITVANDIEVYESNSKTLPSDVYYAIAEQVKQMLPENTPLKVLNAKITEIGMVEYITTAKLYEGILKSEMDIITD